MRAKWQQRWADRKVILIVILSVGVQAVESAIHAQHNVVVYSRNSSHLPTGINRWFDLPSDLSSKPADTVNWHSLSSLS